MFRVEGLEAPPRGRPGVTLQRGNRTSAEGRNAEDCRSGVPPLTPPGGGEPPPEEGGATDYENRVRSPPPRRQLHFQPQPVIFSTPPGFGHAARPSLLDRSDAASESRRPARSGANPFRMRLQSAPNQYQKATYRVAAQKMPSRPGNAPKHLFFYE